MVIKRDVLACQLDSLLFRSTAYCEGCKGRGCKYLQSYPESEIEQLIEQGYNWKSIRI